MYALMRFFLFQLDAERAHHLTLLLLAFLIKIPGIKCMFKKLYAIEDKRLERTVLGITFKNPVGLAAGLDKNAQCIDGFASMGFGHVEIGTVTPVAQPGNEKPRLFRIISDSAIINRMGFNNEGAKTVLNNIKNSALFKKNSSSYERTQPTTIIGGNIGKNKITPNENAVDDYLKCFEELYPVVHYFVVNVSSPNTPDLRALQEKEPLKKILFALQEKNNQQEKRKPILLKIAPDLSQAQLDDILEVLAETHIDGIIATNTTLSRSGLTADEKTIHAIGAGGLSGKPLTQKSTEIIRYLSSKTKGSLPIIAVGGIMTAQDAIDKLNAGASLVQIYTGFIYEGPNLIRAINQKILASLVK